MQYSDCHYLTKVMTALCDSFISARDGEGQIASFSYGGEEDDVDEKKLLEAAVDEIERYGRMDEWISSYHNVFSRTALSCKRRLIQARILPTTVAEFLQFTQPGNYDSLRLSALKDLFDLGVLRNHLIVPYILQVMSHDPSPYVRDGVRRLLFEALAGLALGIGRNEASTRPITTTTTMTNPSVTQQQLDGGLIIEQESSSTEARQADLSRRQTIAGALKALKEEMSGDKVFKDALWKAIQ